MSGHIGTLGSISNSLPNAAGCTLSITSSQTNGVQKGPSNLQVGNNNIDQNHHKTIQIASINQNQKSEVSFPNIVSKSGNSEFVRDKLLQLTSQNVRTV
jgi:hypothetical protein